MDPVPAKPAKLVPVETGPSKIKPCFMMSPLSVAQFVPAGLPHFDLVIMDEASQLRTEDVVGSLLRGRQAVIVGDPHQLPPTNFFAFSNQDGAPDEDEEGDGGQGLDQESVLDLALKTFRPARRLKWHYRSRHQSLIAYSNHEFYDRELIIFPSPYDRHPEYGFEVVPLSGIYEKRRNLKEAEQLVQAAARHMTERPNRSLGIVTMNQEQKELIRDLLDSRAKSDPIMQAFLERWEGSSERERFFVKNLENVQGDERDEIFVSTVYGKDEKGNFFQRFGPINGPMGHRRLNVLFTRAKCKVTVFTSLEPDWIVVDGQSSRGLRAFQGFLRYAKTGELPTPVASVHGGTDSPFEDFVVSALRSHGFDVETQVGVAGYFIDIAIRDPRRPGRFVIGIECDGKTYHSGRSARDRDRLRQENLERLGWHLYRIWSTDWFSSPKRETEKLIDVIRAKIASPNGDDSSPTPVGNHNQSAPQERSVPPASPPPAPAPPPITPELLSNILRWNKTANKMTNSWELGILASLERVVRAQSSGRAADKVEMNRAREAVKRCIELKFDPNRTYSE